MVKNRLSIILTFVCVVMLSACETQRTVMQAPDERREDVEASLQTVVEAISGKEMTAEDVKELKEQVRKNPEAQESIKVISDSYSGAQNIIRYCPISGRRYAAHILICPEHNIPLEVLQP